jgi:hypothetical protein
MAAVTSHAKREPSRENLLRDALTHAEKALLAVDKAGIRPDVAARLQDIIESLQAEVG